MLFPLKNLGGYLPYPPEDCLRKDRWVNYRGEIWIDLSLCHFCDNIKDCQRRIDYLKMVKENGI